MSTWKMEKWNRAGEMQLLAAGPIAAGQEILREKPLFSVSAKDHLLGTSAWDLTNQLLAEPRLRETYYGWKLRSEDIFPASPEDAAMEKLLARRYGVPRAMVRKLYVGVGTNNIGYGPGESDVTGYGLYEVLSRANHSCDPSASLVTLDLVTGEQCLLAKRPLQPGQEITWSYGGEAGGFLKKNFLLRNLFLVQTMGFACHCSRCRQELPEDLKGIDLLRFFKEFIAHQAGKQSGQNKPAAAQGRA
jgi:hypothetical protein